MGAAPLAGITALTAIDALGIGRGDTVLIVGATGGVGTFAVQLAVAAGATVIAPGFPEDEAYLRDLGVSAVLPARRRRRRDRPRASTPDGVDAVLDLVSYAPGAFEGALKDGGRLASPNSAAGRARAGPTSWRFRRARPRPPGGVLADGTLRVPIQATFDLAARPTRSPRSAAPTPAARSQSASPEPARRDRHRSGRTTLPSSVSPKPGLCATSQAWPSGSRKPLA